MRNFTIIAAICDTQIPGCKGIGLKGQLPWPHNPKDMAHFASTTKDAQPGKRNAVIMGRKTYESTGVLPGRVNCVITKSELVDGVHTFRSLLECLEWVGKNIDIERCFVIGGAKLYQEAITSKHCTEAIITHIPGSHVADTFWCGLPDEMCLERRVGEVLY